MADGLTPERVLWAMARPGVGDELRALGVRELSGFNATGAQEFGWPPWNEARIQQVVADALDDDEPTQEQPEPRHRPPDPIPEATVKDLKWELAQRKARPGDREFTQEKIAGRLELDRSRIQQAEALERVGWDLLRSHPEFSASDGFVRWPSAREAARILASERAEN
jgi:hypothetical protein